MADLTTHKYRIGQRVRLAARPVKGGLPDMHYTVVRLLPVSGTARAYRVKGDHEACERVAAESQLSPIF